MTHPIRPCRAADLPQRLVPPEGPAAGMLPQQHALLAINERFQPPARHPFCACAESPLRPRANRAQASFWVYTGAVDAPPPVLLSARPYN